MPDFIRDVFGLINGLFSLIIFVLIAQAISSWLVYFGIINTRNPTVYKILSLLDQMTAPILEPFRRVIPSLGGFDISFIVCVFAIQMMQRYLLPIARDNLIILIGG